ncbi:hypothetical protein SCHPADRAFT_943669 [Schizopora paradoxa]|uniref:Uncharacterized protein n=1 Tax=Schizopora paradoxa TaxID=27342 RepID=A0A0H2RC30_9AGAM|nr:hypothetical protein SCHPADRAFT_943669 [Schizopora paradoxa]
MNLNSSFAPYGQQPAPPFSSRPAMGFPSMNQHPHMKAPMQMSGNFEEETSKVTGTRLIYLAILFMCETTAFGLLMTLNSSQGVFVSNVRGSAVNPPNLLNAMAYCTGFSALAAIIDLVGTFISGIHNPIREFIVSAISFLIFVGWITLDALLQSKSPEKYYCGTGIYENGYCTASMRTIQGLTWTGASIFGLHALFCFVVGAHD